MIDIKPDIESAKFEITRLENENQQLKQRIEQLEREYQEQKAALEIVATKLNLKSSDCNFAHWIDEALAQRDIEQLKQFTDNMLHVVANQYNGDDSTDWSIGANHVFRLFAKHCFASIEQLRKPTESACEHNWVSAKNEYIKNGSFCTKCHAISEFEPEQLRKGGEL